LDEVDDRFGLRQVELPVFEGALSELAGSRQPGTASDEGGQNLINNPHVPVTGEFRRVLASVRMGSGPKSGDKVINWFPVGSAEPTVGGGVWFG
jgi:hypothetical protein